MQADITANIAELRRRIAAAALAAGRAPEDIALLAVSKTRPPQAIRAAAAAGVRAVGENYLQEAIAKLDALADLDLEWHFIGPVQSNKTRELAARFAWVHSVDRLKVARRLSEQRPPDLPPLNICLQLNVSGETSKSGLAVGELEEVALACAALPGVRLRGLMAIPAPSRDPIEQRAAFARVRTAFDALRSRLPQLDTLSMGMSADLEAAIAEGATIVRVGTDLFGARD